MATRRQFDYQVTTDFPRKSRPGASGISKGAAIKHGRMSQAGGALFVTIWRREAYPNKGPWVEWRWVNLHNQVTKPHPRRTSLR